MNSFNVLPAKPSLLVLMFCLWTGLALAQGPPVDSSLVAHEWGTFTSVAGTDGQAMEWLPVNLNDLTMDEQAGGGVWRSKELPSFVEHLHWGAFKAGLRGTVRMETPVLYFYASRETKLSVQVRFSKGLITEWYPHASAPPVDGGLNDASLYRKGAIDGSISWNAVTLQPGVPPTLPRDTRDYNNAYYAARATSSSSLRVPSVKGDQQEKFLFYRGVSLFSVPVSARFTADGTLLVRNSLDQGIPAIIWFQRRGDRVGYRVSDALQNEAILGPPELTSTVDSLAGDVEEVLVAQGLYRDEAYAMVQTWRNHWFEEGSRLFYIVPQIFVDSVLPLTINPAPAQTVRVFVGRLELISPATQTAVAAALASNDQATLAKYARFLEPIMKAIQQNKLRSRGGQPFSSSRAPCPVDYEDSMTVRRQR